MKEKEEVTIYLVENGDSNRKACNRTSFLASGGFAASKTENKSVFSLLSFSVNLLLFVFFSLLLLNLAANCAACVTLNRGLIVEFPLSSRESGF
jgi:hypothetical protein